MIVETECTDIVELVVCRMRKFRAEFYAHLNLTLNVIALCINVFLAFVI